MNYPFKDTKKVKHAHVRILALTGFILYQKIKLLWGLNYFVRLWLSNCVENIERNYDVLQNRH